MRSSIESSAERIKQAGIIAILRGGFSVDETLRIGEALLAGGITVLEVTLNSPAALSALPQLIQRFGREMLLGAGTVRDVEDARQAVRSGAQFLVAPCLDLASVAFSHSTGLLILPGVFTASEAQAAYAAGCRMLKLFPVVEGIGPVYLKALRAPLNDVDFVPTGGISLENIGEFARAGAAAVGIGGKLAPDGSLPSEELTARARALYAAWEAGRHA